MGALLGSVAAVPTETELTRLGASFAGVDTWVFDLDNTLYPAGSTIWPAVDIRITLYLANLFGLDGLSARALQKYYYQRYGTTLRGLMEEQAGSADVFLDFVHDIDRTGLAPNPELGRALTALPGRKLIFTNGSRDHAMRTTEQLGFPDVFEDIFDIVAAELVPKPEAAVYDRFLARHAVDPVRAVMVEDLARNLVVPHALGMRTVLVSPRGRDHRERWEAEGIGAPHVDFVTDDLAGFLRAVTLARFSDVAENDRTA
ncbi:pyrimidine 5'-nucleotidase [Lichenihabitans sp. Uapishka_5]|uniref:pyrimidine 5'-nucleotidase n=1 Tax=Lichenihabitans sp. Uapishka_5 TaxID=3037302 RepID=UPI003FA53CE9